MIHGTTNVTIAAGKLFMEANADTCKKKPLQIISICRTITHVTTKT